MHVLLRGHVLIFLMVQLLFMYVCSVQFCLPRSRLNQPKMAQEDLSVFDSIRRLVVAGKPLEKNEERVVARLAEVAKVVLEEAARELINSSQKMPVLFEYCGHGTPLKLKHALQVSYAEHRKLVRSGYTGVELYCEGAFVRTFDRSGDPVVTCLLRDPISLSFFQLWIIPHGGSQDDC